MRFLFLLFAGWTICLACTAPAFSLDVDPASPASVMVTRETMQYLRTPTDTSWEEAAVAGNSGWSAPRADTVGNFAPDHAQWLRIPVSNPSSERGEYRFEIRWPFTESLQMRLLRREGFGPLLKTGSDSTHDQLHAVNKNVVFPFDLAPGETASVYLRIVDPYFQYLPMFVWTAEAYEGYAEQRLVLLSVAVGVLAVMVLYNAFLFLFTRDRMYLAYTNTVFSTLLLVLAITGIGQRLIWSDFDWLVKNAYPVFSAYAFFSVTLFLRIFVGLKQHGGWVLKANTVILAIWAVALITNILGLHDIGMTIEGLGGPVMTAIGLVSVIAVWRRGNLTARYFVLAWTPVMVVTTYAIFAIFALAPYTEMLDYAMIYSFVFEVVVLAIALAERINRERLAKEEAQALALAQQQSILEMKERANSDLEEQVQKRTRELQSAMAALGRANEELAEMTRTDPLTGLSNRRHFNETIDGEIARAARNGQALSLLIVDIDHFKGINDSYGHLVGDECLKLIGKTIRDTVARETDTVARFGGEEFAVILPATSEGDALLVAERVRQAIAEAGFRHEARLISTTASIGLVTASPGRIPAAEDLVDAADRALYRAKEKGRNRTEIARPAKAALEQAVI